MGNPHATVVMAANLSGLHAGMRDLRDALVLGIPILLVAVAGGSWLLAGRALRPLHLLTAAVESIDARGLHERVREQGFDPELQRLIEVFNATLQRLEGSFRQASRFTADAAHELLTPLTVLQGELEQALQKSLPSAGAEPVREVILLEEVEHLKAIVDKLLMLSQADAGRLPTEAEAVNLSELVEEVAADSEILSGGKVSIEREIVPGINVLADPLLLHQVLQNLATNAIRYNRAGGVARFAVARQEGAVVVRVANTGPGIPIEAREKVFERFYRVDPPGRALGERARAWAWRSRGKSLVLTVATCDCWRTRASGRSLSWLFQ